QGPRHLGSSPIEPFTRRLARIDAQNSPSDLWIAWATMRRADAELARFFERFDVSLSPVLGEPPWPIGRFDPGWSDEVVKRELFTYLGTTHVANTTGLPALSLPLHRTPQGLPVGVHVLAPWGREDHLLALGAELEEAYPWDGQWPMTLENNS